MERFDTINGLRERIRAARAAGETIGFVPTMGALHEGHLTLIREARAQCDRVAISVFVNPTQFNDPKDLEAYPRDLEKDMALASEAGADILFAPEPAEMYPEGFNTKIVVDGAVARRLEGEFRPGHFEGVATVVAKLLLIVQPDKAFFGEKDWQQLKVVERMARDLNLPVQIVPVPTVRDTDSLALSSRNARLSPEGRKRARIIPYLLDTADELVGAGTPEQQTHVGPVLRHWLVSLLQTNEPTVEIDYIAVVDPETLLDIDEITDRALVAVAVRIEGVRLIDNRIVRR